MAVKVEVGIGGGVYFGIKGVVVPATLLDEAATVEVEVGNLELNVSCATLLDEAEALELDVDFGVDEEVGF